MARVISKTDDGSFRFMFRLDLLVQNITLKNMLMKRQ